MTLPVSMATQRLVESVRAALWSYTEADYEAAPLMRSLQDALQEYDKAKAAEKTHLEKISEELSRVFNKALAPDPSYLFWRNGFRQFCWNTQPYLSDPDGRWFAWEFDAKTGKVVRRVRCATRTKAKAKAYEWYQKAEGK